MKQMTLEKFSEVLCSGTPAPGGGSVSALVGALAASLSGMVANLTLGNGKYPGVQAQMADIAARADQLRKELLEDVQRDSAAFDGCMAAYGMPRQTDAEKATRREAIQRALEGAATVPLCVAQKGLEILTLAKQVIQNGNKNALTDALVCVAMARASIRGALWNVKCNIDSLPDKAAGEAMLSSCKAVAQESRRLETEALALAGTLANWTKED